MTTDTHDEIALPAFEDALWSALRAEHARATAPSTSPADEVEVLDPLAAPPRRPLVRRALAAAAAVALLGAAAVLAVRAGDDGGAADVGPVATEADPTTTTLAPEARLADALRELTTTHVVATDERVDDRLVRQSWSDDTSGTRHGIEYREDGERPRFELGLATGPDPEAGLLANPPMRAIDHCARQWAASGGPNLSSDLRRLADDLDEGRAVVDGTEVVAGRELLVVRPVSTRLEIDPETGELVTPPTPSTEVQPYNATYVDPETSHPVMTDPGPVADPAAFPVVTYRLLPRDPSTLDLLVADAPAGYQEVDVVPTDEERAAAGCT
jgi:hypothetical protein